MNRQQIKVIKRAERERSVTLAARSPRTVTPANEEARALAAAVSEWISEFRQTRLKQGQEIRRQLGWPEDGGRDAELRVERDPDENEA